MDICTLGLRFLAATEGEGGGGLLSIDPLTVSVQIAGFLLLYLILSRFLFKPIGKVLEDRRSEIASSYAKVEADLAAAAQQQAELTQRLSSLESEARERMQAVLREAQGMKDQILAEANEQRERIISAGHEQAERDRQAVTIALREEMAALAIAAASKVLEEALDVDRHRKLVDDFIQQVGAN
ncbi:MAG TPA: F0F1 ATP synthase subunit B [Armatimonadota bacterium]